jgi:predicted DNA-binding transcriptional regulator AlpA
MNVMSVPDTLSKRNPPPCLIQDFSSDQVVSPATAARLMNISRVTLWRMWRRGEGPKKLQVSPNRCGVRLRDIQAYLDRAAA